MHARISGSNEIHWFLGCWRMWWGLCPGCFLGGFSYKRSRAGCLSLSFLAAHAGLLVNDCLECRPRRSRRSVRGLNPDGCLGPCAGSHPAPAASAAAGFCQQGETVWCDSTSSVVFSCLFLSSWPPYWVVAQEAGFETSLVLGQARGEDRKCSVGCVALQLWY